MNKSCFNLGSNGPLKRLFDGTQGERERERKEGEEGGRESEKVRKREKEGFFSADKLCQ